MIHPSEVDLGTRSDAPPIVEDDDKEPRIERDLAFPILKAIHSSKHYSTLSSELGRILDHAFEQAEYDRIYEINSENLSDVLDLLVDVRMPFARSS